MQKNFVKTLLTVVLASAAIVGGAYAYRSFGQPADPVAVTKAFYAEWLSCEGSPLAGKLYQDHDLLADPFEQKIQETVDSFEFGGFDPVLMAQDKPQKLDFTLSRSSESFALVHVKEDFGGSIRELKVDLSKEGDKWLISDIRDAENTGPLANSRDSQNTVGDYIREHISELSPEKAVLGGTFHVVKIEFVQGNKALVDYEDGHIALRAEAGYELLPDGSVRIDSFKLVD